MIEVNGTIINENNGLVGLVMTGKPRDFGEIGPTDEKETKFLDLQLAKGYLRNCRNFTIKGGKITALTKKRMSELNMYNVKGVRVDNRMKIISKIVQTSNNGEKKDIVGFDVNFAHSNATARYKYQDVVTLSGWFKPDNFIVKYTADGKAFISGKPGAMRLDDLPEFEVVTNSKRALSNKKRNVEHPVTNRREGMVNTNRVDNVLKNNLDIFAILDKVREADGLIMWLNTDENKYRNTTDVKAQTGSAFQPLNTALLAYPEPVFSADKAKVNLLFKKPGFVTIGEGVDATRAYSFVYKNRTIIKNGENYIKSIGVAVPSEKADELLHYFGVCGGELHISEITDVNIIKSVQYLVGTGKEYKYYKVDLSKIGILSPRAEQYAFLQMKDLAVTVGDIAQNQAALKCLRYALKESHPGYSNTKKTISPMFSMYKEEVLNKLVENGIDIYSGAYTRKEDVEDSERTRGTDASDAPISIAYELKGYNVNSVTGKDLATGTDKAKKNDIYQYLCKFNQFFKAATTTYPNIANCVADNPEEAYKEIKRLEKEVAELQAKIWRFNTRMLQEGSYRRIFVNNGRLWEEIPTRAKSGHKYVCTDEETNGRLLMAVDGVTVG